MTEIAVGKEILSYCGKCKLTLSHMIVLVKSEGVVGNVLCNTCKTTHAYRDPDAKKKKAVTKKKTKKISSSKGGGKSVQELYVDAMASANQGIKPYTIRESFNEGDIIEHKIFGKGVVEKVLDSEKIQVLFPTEAKILVHGK